MRKGYIIVILTSVAMQVSFKIGGKVVHIYELVIYREKFKISPSKKVIQKLPNFGSKYEDECKDLMRGII